MAARVSLQLDPVEVAGSGLVRGVEALGHDSFETPADVVEQVPSQDLSGIGLRQRRRQQRVGFAKQLLDDRETSLVGQRRQVGSVAEHHVEDEGSHRHSGGHLLNALLAPSRSRLLERDVLL